MSPEEGPAIDRKGVRVLCRPGVGAGFELAGLRVSEVETAADGERELERVRQAADVGVVLIEREVYDELSEEILHSFSRRPVPVLVPFPGPAWTAGPSPETYLLELLRRAVGYRVRLQ